MLLYRKCDYAFIAVEQSFSCIHKVIWGRKQYLPFLCLFLFVCLTWFLKVKYICVEQKRGKIGILRDCFFGFFLLFGIFAIGRLNFFSCMVSEFV